jgi:hypothetical protein
MVRRAIAIVAIECAIQNLENQWLVRARNEKANKKAASGRLRFSACVRGRGRRSRTFARIRPAKPRAMRVERSERRLLQLLRLAVILHRFVRVALDLVLVLDDLPVEFVDHEVDRRVHISVTTLDKNVLAL